MTKSFKQCRGCKKTFLAKKKSQVFHDDLCREEYYNVNIFHRITATKICPNCGESFTTNKPFLQTYCLSGCREKARTKRYYGEELPYLEEATQGMARLMEGYPNPRGHSSTLEVEEKLRQRGYNLTSTTSTLQAGKKGQSRPCHRCGNIFKIKRKGQIYCNPGCRERSHAEQLAEQRRVFREQMPAINHAAELFTKPRLNLEPSPAEICPVCRIRAVRGDHHIRPRVEGGAEGGAENSRNLVKLCKVCHDVIEEIYQDTGQLYCPEVVNRVRLMLDERGIPRVTHEQPERKLRKRAGAIKPAEEKTQSFLDELAELRRKLAGHIRKLA